MTRWSAETAAHVVHDVQRSGRAITLVHRPRSLLEALVVLAEDSTVIPVAGGTDLLLDLQRGGPGDPVSVLDLTAIKGMDEISDEGDQWRLGGGVTHNHVVGHPELRDSVLPLAQACLEIGSPQLRNRATLAGNIVTASPANDSISALMALNARVELVEFDDGDAVETVVPIREFFTGFRETVLSTGQLVSAILVPKLAATERGIWVKLGLRKAQAISVIHAGLVVDLDDDDSVQSVSLAIGSVAPTVIMVDVEDVLVGEELTPEFIEAAAVKVADAISPISDTRATADYRRTSVVTLISRSLAAIANDQQSAVWPSQPPTLRNASKHTTAVPTTLVDLSTPITVMVNGEVAEGAGSTDTLLDWIRDTAGLTGMKEGCAEGECGACTMLLDGEAVMSCLVTAAQADGRTVTTIEGLKHPIQQAFIDDFAVQCGFCIPGFLMSAASLLDENDEPTDEQISLGLSGNLCRCTGYYPIVEAVKDAAVTIRESS